MLAFLLAAAPARAAEGQNTLLGFPITFSGYEATSTPEGMEVKAAGAVDLSSILGPGAVLQAGSIEIDTQAHVTLTKLSLPAFSLGPFEGNLAVDKLVVDHAATATEPFLLDVTLGVKLNNQTLQATARLPITPQGLADGEVPFSPPKGQNDLLKLTQGDLSLVVKGGTLTLLGGAVQKATFSGALTVLGSELAVQNLTVENGKISGHAEGRFDLDQVALSLPQGLDFEVGQSGDIMIKSAAAEFDFSGVLADVGKLSIQNLTFEKGQLNAEASLEKTMVLDGVSLSLASARVTGSKAGGVTAAFDGSLGLEGLDLKADFTGFTVDSKGNVAGEILFDPPVTVNVSGLAVSLQKAALTKKDASLTAALTGQLKLGEDTLRVTHLGVKNKKPWVTLGVSEQEPFAFSWLPYVKLTQLGLEDDLLTLGGAVDLPDPLKYTFSFKDTKIDLENKKPTLGDKLERRLKAFLKKNTLDMVFFENTNTQKMALGPLKLGLDAIAIPNPFATHQKALSGDTLLELFVSTEVTVGKTTVAFNLDGLAFSKEGLKDITLTVKPAEGKLLLADLSLAGIGSLKLASAKVDIKNKKLSRISFPGAKLKMDAPDLDLDFADLGMDLFGNLLGSISWPAFKSIDLPGVGLSLSGLDLGSLDGLFSVTFRGKLKFGLDWIPIKTFKISSLGWNVELDASLTNPFKLSWLPFIRFSQLKFDKLAFTLGGDLDLPDLGNFKFAFKDVKLDLKTPDLPVVFLNTDTRFMTWEGLSIRVGSISLPNPLSLGKLPKTPEVVLGLSLSTSVELLGKKIALDINGLNFGKTGLLDLKLNLTPSKGSLFKEKLLNWAELDLKGLSLEIKNKKLAGFGFNGNLGLDGKTFEITFLGLSKDLFKGSLTLPKDPKISLGDLSLEIGKEISFEIATKAGGNFSLSLKNVTLDATALLGEKAKLVFDTLTYSKGAMFAESSKGLDLKVGPFALNLSKFNLKSEMPKTGKRVVEALLHGNLKLSTFNLNLAFKDFKVSSAGTMDGTIAFSPVQSWKVFGYGVELKSMTFAKGEKKDPLVITLKGKFKFSDSASFDFDNLKFVDGKPVLVQEFKNPLTVDVKIVKISVTRVELGAGQIKLTGKVKIPVINVELSAKDFAINSSGMPTGGSISLDRPVSFTAAKFGITVKKASIDVTNKVFVWDADIELFGTKIPIKDLRISLGSSPAHDLTKKSSTKPQSLKIDLIGLNITPTAMDFGMKDFKFYFAFSGKLKILTSELEFTNLRVYQDYTFTVDEVKGKIGLSPFVVNIKSASFGKDFLKFTGDMNIPMVGTATVSNLKVSKTGVFLESASVIVEKPGFSYALNLAFKDNKFTGEGTLEILKNKFMLSVLVETSGLTLTITGEPKLQLGAGLALSRIKGKLVQKFKTEIPDISLSGRVVYLDEKFLRADVSMAMDGKTDYSISGEVTILDTLKIAKMKIEGNISKGTFLASGNLNVTVLNLVGLNVDISLGSTDKTVPSETKLKEPRKCEASTKIFSKNPYYNCALKKLEDDAHRTYRRDYGKELTALEDELGPKWKKEVLDVPIAKKMCKKHFDEDDSFGIFQCALGYIWGFSHPVRTDAAWLKAFKNIWDDLKKEKEASKENTGKETVLKCDSSGNCFKPDEHEMRRWMSLALSACVDGPKSQNATTRADMKTLLKHFQDCDGWDNKPVWCDYNYKKFYDLPWQYAQDHDQAAQNPAEVCPALFGYPGSPVVAARALNPYDYSKGDYTYTEAKMKTRYGGFHKKSFTEKTIYLSCDQQGNNCVSDSDLFKLPKMDKDLNLSGGETDETLNTRARVITAMIAQQCEKFSDTSGYYGDKWKRYAYSGQTAISPDWCSKFRWEDLNSERYNYGWDTDMLYPNNSYYQSWKNHTVTSFLMAMALGYDPATSKFPGRLKHGDWGFFAKKPVLDLDKRGPGFTYDDYLAYFFGGDPGSFGLSSTPLRDKDFVTKFEASGTVTLMGQEFSVKVVENDKKLKFNANKEFDFSIVDGSFNVAGVLGVGEFAADVAAKLDADIPLIGSGSLAGKASLATKKAGSIKTKIKLSGCMKITAAEVVGAVINKVSSWFGGPSEVVPVKICKKFDANVTLSKDGLDFPSIKDTIKGIFK